MPSSIYCVNFLIQKCYHYNIVLKRDNAEGTAMIRKLYKGLIAKCLMAALVFYSSLYLVGCSGHVIGMLNPKGLVTFEERKLFFDTLALMLIVVLPVIIMSITFVYHYQQSHRITDYRPDWGHSVFLETLWWGIPCIIITILAIMTWKQTHELDPYKTITGHSEKPLIVQVIALPWKWLFIYPKENIATVNYLVMPVGRQVEFLLTSDNVPMSAFFIPEIGSQIYAMAGMRTELHLEATETGDFDGLNTQYNGDGFAGMHFKVHVVKDAQMQQWIAETKRSTAKLTNQAYGNLLNQSIEDKPQFFSGVKPGLFDDVLTVYQDTTGSIHPRENQLKLHYQIF